MKKDMTDRERFDLAHELDSLSVTFELDGKGGTLSKEESEYRVDLMGRAIYAICPDYDDILDDEVSNFIAQQNSDK